MEPSPIRFDTVVTNVTPAPRTVAKRGLTVVTDVAPAPQEALVLRAAMTAEWPRLPHEVPRPPSEECPIMAVDLARPQLPQVPQEAVSPSSYHGGMWGSVQVSLSSAASESVEKYSMQGSPVRARRSLNRSLNGTSSRHSMGSIQSVESWRNRRMVHWTSWAISDHEELIDNEFVSALHHRGAHTVLSVEDPGMRGARKHVVDWDMQSNKEKLRDLRHLVRSLFWAFADEDEALQAAGLDWPSERRGSILSDNSTYRQARDSAKQAVRHEAFSAFFMVLTVYALFGPDTLLACGHSAQNKEDLTLAIFNTVVLLFFVLEEALNCWVVPGYLLSGRFWMDTFAAASIIGDTWLGLWIGEIIDSDAAVAGRGSRMVRLVRLGGRSTRLVRIFRVTRLLQVVKFIPKIQEWLQKDTQQLAYLLWQKRLWHVFRVLDKQGNGKLDDEQMEFFDVAMFCEFGAAKGLSHSMTTVVSEVGDKMGEKIIHTAHIILGDERGFRSIADVFKRTLIGRRSLRRCVEDVLSMKESCVLVERAISGLALKCCLLVLALLILTQLMAKDEEELALSLGLNQLDIAARSLSEGSSTTLCQSMVAEYSKVSSQDSMLLLILNNRVWWNETCRCCGATLGAVGLFVGEPTSDGGVVDGVVLATGLESHELKLEEVIVDGSHRSVALFDQHLQARSEAASSILGTFVVVTILLALVVFFATDMKRISNYNVLHPLWDLMDDMCALKSLEVLGKSDQDDAGDESQALRRLSTSPARSAMGCKVRLHRPVPVAEELVRLRDSFGQLRKAMVSWSKFVPVSLLKQLFRAKVEAQIGAGPCDLTVFFCHVSGFQEFCEDMSPKEVLGFLECVLARVYKALEEHSGTMLEFIGDEVLAVFNAPLPVADHQQHALAAALQAQRLVAEQPIPALKGQSARVACSVHRAQVLAGNLGAPTRMKYGVLGDGVNLCARLKSLNTRFGTGMLASQEALDFPGSQDIFVTRPVGKLILKGRNTPTSTHEVLGLRVDVPEHVRKGAEAHQRGFELFCARSFAEAKQVLHEAHELLSRRAAEREPGNDMGDPATLHHIRQCEKYLAEPPPDGWDGSERLDKKSW